METYLDITKGLHTDFEEPSQAPGTYKFLSNAVRALDGSLQNERGTKFIKEFEEVDRRVVGSYVLDDQIVFFSVSEEDSISEIGVLLPDDIYEVITNDTSLGFKLDTIVRAEGKRNFKNERIIYFTGKGLPIRVLNLDQIPTASFDDNTKLVLTADMPQISINNVVDGGTLPTGVYQFGVRLLTKSTNATSISLLTNPISVIDEDLLDRDLADGAPPQTTSNKAISLNVSNIDVDYEFIELVAITYIGTANVLKANVITRIPIQGRVAIDYVYSNVTQNREDLDITGLTVDASNYDSAEFIIQKDGILILGGLTSSVTDYNFQTAVNKTVMKYVIKEVEWLENISISGGTDLGTSYPVGEDYKNAKVAADFKSYQRDEVYSFALVPVFSNWSMGNAYHIPAPFPPSAAVRTEANTTTKLLGTYWSEELYPANKGFPTVNPGLGLSGERVRHHVMPSLRQEPHVQTRNGSTYIRMLGVSVDLTAVLAEIPDAVKTSLIGFVVSKQKRDAGEKSILAQGIASGHYTLLNSTFVPVPYSGHSPFTNNGGFNYSGRMVSFQSPETIITRNDMSSATTITPVIEMVGKSHIIAEERNGNSKRANMFLNYNSTGSNTVILGSSRTLNQAYTKYISGGAEKDRAAAERDLPVEAIPGLGLSIMTWRHPGHLFLYINADLPNATQLHGDGKGEIYYKIEPGTDGLYLNGRSTDAGQFIGDTVRHLYNLTRPRVRQYGSIFEARYHYVKHVMMETLAVNPVIECFNGDMFITKFGVSNGSAIGYIESDFVDTRSLNYFWVESEINCGYRHFKAASGTEGQPGYVQGTIPYYPKTKTLFTTVASSPGILNYSASLGHPVGYNKQYSFENTIRPYFPPSIEIEPVNNFPNRLIYSDKSVEGEQLDAFRILLANNFHDIPKEKGKITDIFIQNNRLYTHTERGLWRTYFNEQVTQASSSGEVYLGNGGVFNRPATEVLTVKGGYAGTKSSCGVSTPFGRMFIDEIQKKVFMFSEELKEISDQGMFQYFKDNLQDIANTPALGVGYASVYDYENKRWILTKIGEWTLSYSIQLNSWSSFHNYTPYHYVSNGTKVFSVNEHLIHENNVGIYGVYYDSLPNPMQLDIVINDAVNETKTFDNLIFHTTSKQGIKEQHYDTFNTLHCYNSTKNTGKCRLIVPRSFDDEFIELGLFEAFAKLKSNEFRVAIPNDLVIDPENDIFDINNLDNSRAYRPRISGKYMVVSLTYNNLRDNKFVLHNIGRLFRQRIR